VLSYAKLVGLECKGVPIDGGRLWLCPWSSSLDGFIVGFCENRQSRWWLETQEMTIHPEGGTGGELIPLSVSSETFFHDYLMLHLIVTAHSSIAGFGFFLLDLRRDPEGWIIQARRGRCLTPTTPTPSWIGRCCFGSSHYRLWISLCFCHERFCHCGADLGRSLSVLAAGRGSVWIQWAPIRYWGGPTATEPRDGPLRADRRGSTA